MNFAMHLFKLNYTKTVGKKGHERMKKNAAYRREFGNMPVVRAYAQFKAQYEERTGEVERRAKKVEAFEKYLIANGAKEAQSKKSESRYYYYQNKQYRFSGHVHPCGSLTNEFLGEIDLCADSHLIYEIEKQLNITL
ncbi:hypothetical protein [Prevotella intermedia]|uniref:hypothetical protein n=1 Tax=Prevotella intermedia TaxID=28131 RepID=UPI0012FDB9D5|nr:hypothetical protein [Prevotella intermedia]